MLEKKQIENIIFTALTSLNAERDEDKKIDLKEDTVLFGKGSNLDSLALVSVVVDIETVFNSDYNLELSLTNDRAMSREVSPFSTVGTLRDYIFELVSE
jgi:acyl carrier protein